MKAWVEEVGFEYTDIVSPPPSYEIWKIARTKSDGQMTSQSTYVIVDKIVSINIFTNIINSITSLSQVVRGILNNCWHVT